LLEFRSTSAPHQAFLGDTKTEHAMSKEPPEAAMTVRSGLEAITKRLTDAVAIAKAALACANAGAQGRAVQIALDLEEPVREANTLLNMISLLQRMSDRWERDPEG
jgi:hypothetical protein